MITVGVNRKMAINIGKYFTDADANDKLTITMPKSTDQSSVSSLDLSFSPSTFILAGTPPRTATLGLLTFTATDPHGSYASLYLTLKIIETAPTHRKNTLQISSIEYVYSEQRFAFGVPDGMFFDAGDGSTLVLFVSTEYDSALPKWIKFDPLSRNFYGVAPYVAPGN